MRRNTKFKRTEIGLIPEDWEVKKLADVCLPMKGSIISGPFGSNISSKYFVAEGIPVIRGNNLTLKMNKFIDDSFVFITEDKAKELNTWAFEDDLVFTAAGTLGQVGIIPRERQYEKYIISNKQLRARLDKNKVVPLFVFYWFKSNKMVVYINIRNTGSTIPLINLSILRSLPIPCTNIAEQHSIVKILSDIDSKIELNQKMKSYIEAIAQALFKHWFIDFEFPNEKGKPYKLSGGAMVDSELGKIPKGWEVRKLGDFIDVIKGCSYSSEDLKESDIALATLKSINRGGGFNQQGYKEYVGEYRETQILGEGEIIVAQTDITQKADVIGRPAIVNSLGKYKRLIASLDLQIIRPKKEINNSFLYYILETDGFHNHAISFTNGTTVLHLNKNAVPDYSFVLPPIKLVIIFDKIIRILTQKKLDNDKQISALAQIRDALLPKLMSGQIRVPFEAGI